MRFPIQLLGIGVGLALAGRSAWAQVPEPVPHRPVCPAPAYVVPQPFCPQLPQPLPPGPPAAPATPEGKPQPAPEPVSPEAPPDLNLEGLRAGAGLGETFAMSPAMFGDQLGPVVSRVVRLPSGATVTARVPLAARGAFKIADNGTAIPTDRVFFNYNYFNDVALGSRGLGLPAPDLHREVIGFEKTFLDRTASIEMRLPFLQLQGDGSVSRSGIGDLTIIGKYAFFMDREAGNVLAGGLAVTVPTGASNVPGFGVIDIHDTLLQPFVGYIWNVEDFYVLGFTSLVVPTDSRDVTLLFNDISVGYWLRRNRQDLFINSIIPTLEVHVTTPLNHRGLNNTPVGAPDEVSLTGGVHLLMPAGADLGIAVNDPITGPKPYAVEALVQLNFRF
jgi:hypothetical protein